MLYENAYASNPSPNNSRRRINRELEISIPLRKTDEVVVDETCLDRFHITSKSVDETDLTTSLNTNFKCGPSSALMFCIGYPHHGFASRWSSLAVRNLSPRVEQSCRCVCNTRHLYYHCASLHYSVSVHTFCYTLIVTQKSSWQAGPEKSFLP